jgi:hypothetical protein
VKRTLVTLIALAMPRLSQTTIKEALVNHWKASAGFTIAVAEAMPAEDYNFKPNPEEMSFGQLMAHISLANLGACSIVSGLPAPTVPDKIAAFAKDNCIAANPRIIIIGNLVSGVFTPN